MIKSLECYNKCLYSFPLKRCCWNNYSETIDLSNCSFNESVQENIKQLFYIIRREWNILKSDNSRFNELAS